MAESEDGYMKASFVLKINERPLQFEIVVPAGEITLRELLPSLFDFNRQLLDYAVNDAKQEERTVSCRAGCGACCRQLVPITSTEAMIVREWVESRPLEEMEAIRKRFVRVMEGLEKAGMLDRLRNRATIPDPEATRALGLDYFRAGQPCPFLVEESCSIYPVRPMKCREYLVTTPAINCAAPSADNIRMIDFPVSFLKILLHMEAWLTGRKPLWLPLSLLYEVPPSELELPKKPGPEMFQRFVAEFVALGSSAQAE